MERKKLYARVLNRCADALEMVVAVILLGGVIVLLVSILRDHFLPLLSGQSFDYSGMLAQMLNLIIGVEFTRMLCKHTPDTIIEVLMFATARYLIVDHSSLWNTFLGVIAIGILFVLRKYMLPGADDAEKPHFSLIRWRTRKDADEALREPEVQEQDA